MSTPTNGRSARIAATLALCVLASCAFAPAASAAIPANGPTESVGIDGVAVNATATNGTVTTNDTATNASLVVRGVTNRQPDETAVLLSLRATNGTTTRLATADSWGWDGEWSAAFDLDGVPPGVYRVEATTGDDTDVAFVRLGSEASANGTTNASANGMANASAITVE
ncbi:hypothetical protein J2752_001733 [Halarchaeum rubridurum]|uniref:Uncharacterized protein n=1 Tax=Halarchaeum rubridurum TaxID=489911 RepID=A0A830FXH7_9EURY|nr:hypothetical protein [Halarchaeum rubridurum]MBP1954821.1 hypothetical protein [Halarchaeum rubridurum]GGM60003.1 hypothetical protein GCM10009017_07710 [Halarchaeum rubridurum]